MSDFKKSAWVSYRRRRNAVWISLPLFAGVAWLLPKVIGELGVFVAFIPAFVSLLGLQFYKCPRCQKLFFYDILWRSTEQCVHCGLPKWAEANYIHIPRPPAYPTPRSDAPPPDKKEAQHRQRLDFITLVLRDDPGAIHLSLDSEGWADVNNLLTRANRYGFKLTREELADVLASPGNDRFEWDQPGGRIRVLRRWIPLRP